MGKKPDKKKPGTIKLVDLPRLISSESSGSARATYNQCYSAAVNGEIPAVRSQTGSRWLVLEEDLPVVIKKFSLLTQGESDGDEG